MPTAYADVLEHLRALGPELAPTPGTPPRKFDLAHMRALMTALGNPQANFASILIAGTNGKGSTAATLASILTAAGIRTGLYTSPHLVRVNERMQLAIPSSPSEYSTAEIPATLGQATLEPIADEDFARLYTRVDTAGDHLVAQELLPHTPSFFERLTALALLWFAERRVEIAVLEVGLGGRLDATNVVDPVLSILTDIALDHQEYLGTTLAAITREKAGILRPNGTLITLPQHQEVNQALGEIAAGMPDLRALSAANYIPPAVRGDDPGQQPASSPNPQQSAPRNASQPAIAGTLGSAEEGTRRGTFGSIDARAGLSPDRPSPLASNSYVVDVEGDSVLVASPLPGQHQQRNIALAIAAAVEIRNHSSYRISAEAIAAGIRRTHWPGRLETLHVHGRTLLLDVAHNPAGAWTLRAAIAQLDQSHPRTLLFSCLRDKDLSQMAQILFPLFDGSSTDPERRGDHLVLAPIDSPRAAHVDDLLREAHRLEIPAHAAPHLQAALSQAIEITPEGGCVIVTGSVYLVGAVRSLLGQRS